MKKHLFLTFFAAAGLSLAGCESQRTTSTTETTTTTEQVATGTTPVSTAPATITPETHTPPTDLGNVADMSIAGTYVSDADFATKAISSGMAEVKFGALADRKAIN